MSAPLSTTSLHGPVLTSRGATGSSIALRYFCSISRGGAFIAMASRDRLAWRLVSTG